MIQGLPLALIAARAHDGVIGAANRLPWHIPTDLARFQALTLTKPVIMGRTTFDAIGRVLPGRTTIVLSRGGPTDAAADVVYAASPAEALAAAARCARESGAGEIMVAGGAQVFAALLPSADRLYLTDVDLRVAGDTYFPTFDVTAWAQTRREAPPRGPKDGAAISFVDLRRVRPDTPL